MIELKNVSKFYYNKGVIASGFTKVNLKLDMGEFVAITGESGSGKSTLLNVISGLDSYEEGEMYINGQETSHYTEKDFEDYRRKYIGNIFQNFNLVNSYTVYQNVELVLLLNGANKKDVKDRVLNLIKQVDLYRFRNTKVSKLSGGQKQRVAIARALAKNTPIIIADEPTGNLDSKSARSIIKLLSEIAKDKLVIIVTHNYEQVEDYVTRKIKMHDGKILEDKKIKKVEKEIDSSNYAISYQNITFLNKIRLGLRNTFNILPKFLLLLAVYLFVVVALMSEYSTFKKEEFEASTQGSNYVFNDTSINRIVINKKDKSIFNDSDYEAINKLDNIERIEKYDLVLENHVELNNQDYLYFYGSVHSLDTLNDTVDIGRMPENDNEIVIEGNKNDYYLGSLSEEVVQDDFYLSNILVGDLENKKSKVVGIRYFDDDDDYTMNFYVDNELLKEINTWFTIVQSDIKVLFMNNYYDVDYYNNNFKVIPSNYVAKGNVYISEDLSGYCEYGNCLNKQLKVEIDNLYTKASANFNISNMYNAHNMNSLLGISNYEEYNGSIFINTEDYDSLFNKGSYQSSVFVKDPTEVDSVTKSLEDMGYHPLAIKDTLVSNNLTQVLRIMKTVVTIILVATLLFISYFVIKIVLKSRNIYFSTIRMLGGSKKVSKQLLIIELLAVANIAYFLFILFISLNRLGFISLSFVDTIINYLSLGDYILLYLILILMSYIISLKYAKKLFKNSVIKTLAEEV